MEERNTVEDYLGSEGILVACLVFAQIKNRLEFELIVLRTTPDSFCVVLFFEPFGLFVVLIFLVIG